MKITRRMLAIVLALVMVLSLAACGSPANKPSGGDNKETKAAESLLVKDESEYAKMSEDELYQAALKEYQEGHTLVVYSETGSTEKSTKKFEEKYPGLTVEVSKKKAKDLVTLIPTEAKSETAYSDLVVTSDSTGSIYEEWYKNGYVFAYYPPMVSDLNQDYVAYGLPITIECNVWYYNTEAFPNGSPINNWWQLLEQNEDGSYKYKLCTHPASTLSLASDFCNLVLHSDEMAKAYEDLYGKPLEYTYDAAELGVPENNAGYEWIYRYLQSSYTLFTDSDEICTYVNSGTADDPIFGYGTGIKLGDEKTTWLKGTVTFVANPPCACRSLGSGLIPALDTPIPEQLTDSNATCIKNFTAAGSMPSVSENGAYPPAVHLAVAGSFTRLVLGGAGGITIDYQAIADTVYVDTERMTVYRKNNGSRISLSGQTSGSFEAVAAQAGALPISGTGLNIAVRMLVTEHG